MLKFNTHKKIKLKKIWFKLSDNKKVMREINQLKN